MFNKLKSKIYIRKNTMSEKEAIKIFYDVVTGKMTTENFWELYCSDERLRNALIHDKKRVGLDVWDAKKGKYVFKKCWFYNSIYNKVPFDRNFEYNPDTLLEKVDISRLEDRNELLTVLRRYLRVRDIDIPSSQRNADEREYYQLMGLLPSWVETADIEWLRNLYSSAPKELNKKEKTAWCKEEIKKLYRYDSKRPQWIQPAQWPVVDGVPLVFSHQETSEDGFEQYFFYDPETKAVTVVEQCE